MKLTGVILLAFCLQVSAAKVDKEQIVINTRNVTLEKLFSEIEKKAPYIFSYDETILKETKPVRMAVTDATVEGIMKQGLVG